jgi:hypothetical protein
LAVNKQKLVEVYRAKDSPKAHLLKLALEEAGIPAVVEGDLLQGAVGEIPVGWSTAPRIVVEETDAMRARQILEQFEEQLGAKQLKGRKAQAELRKVKQEIAALKKQLAALQARQAELEAAAEA